VFIAINTVFHIIYYPLYMLIMQVYHNSIRMRDFGRMPDSGQKTWLRSYVRLQSHFPTPVDVVYLTLVTHHGSSQWACHMYYHLSCERLHMTELDDCSILQPRHLVRSRLGGMHDSFNVWNINISWIRIFKSHAMCHVPCDQWTLSLAWFERNLSIQKDLVPPIIWVDQGLRMSG
jgi:hypothetical protein